jgi:hypothetical protein
VHFARNFTWNHRAEYPFLRITTAITSISRDTYTKFGTSWIIVSTSAVLLAEHISSLCEVYTKLWEFFYRLVWVWSSKYAAFVFCILLKVSSSFVFTLYHGWRCREHVEAFARIQRKLVIFLEIKPLNHSCSECN